MDKQKEEPMGDNNSTEIHLNSAARRRDLDTGKVRNLDPVMDRIAQQKAAEMAAAIARGEVTDPADQPKAANPLDQLPTLKKLWKKRFTTALIDEYLAASRRHKIEDLLDMDPTDVQAKLHRPLWS